MFRPSVKLIIRNHNYIEMGASTPCKENRAHWEKERLLSSQGLSHRESVDSLFTQALPTAFSPLWKFLLPLPRGDLHVDGRGGRPWIVILCWTWKKKFILFWRNIWQSICFRSTHQVQPKIKFKDRVNDQCISRYTRKRNKSTEGRMLDYAISFLNMACVCSFNSHNNFVT